MEDVRRTRGARRTRLTSRRQQRNQRYGRFLRMTAIGTLVPGTGLIAAGKRRLGTFLLVVLGLALVAAVFVVVTVPRAKLASYAGDRQMMLILGAGLIIGAAVWLLVALGTHRSLEPTGLPPGKRLGGALVVVVVASLVVAPMAVGARYAFTQRDLIGAIAADGDEVSQTTPQNVDKKNPWENKARLNLLLLGAVVGLGRGEENGIRPDTQIVVSIDTKTGDATMISLPRNLSRMPFPDDSPLQSVYPNGYIDQNTGDPLSADSFLNSVYKDVPRLHPGLGVSASDANKWAVEGALGIDVDYYMMANLDGFSAIINALNGITIDVTKRVPISYGEPNGSCLSRADFIEPGEQHLDGRLALMYSRSRCNSDNYQRMSRQQCVMKAVIAEADPAKLLTQYQSLASAAKGMIKTDIPADLFPAIIELTVKVQGSNVETVNLDNDFLRDHGGTAADPDYDAVHAAIAEELAPKAPAAPPTGGATNAPDSGGTTGDTGEDTSDDTSQAEGKPAGASNKVDTAPTGSTTDTSATTDTDEESDDSSSC